MGTDLFGTICDNNCKFAGESFYDYVWQNLVG